MGKDHALSRWSSQILREVLTASRLGEEKGGSRNGKAEIWWLVDAKTVVSWKESYGGLSEPLRVPKRQTVRTRVICSFMSPKEQQQ